MDEGILFICIAVATFVLWPAMYIYNGSGTVLLGYYRRRMNRGKDKEGKWKEGFGFFHPWLFAVCWVVAYLLITAAEIYRLITSVGSISALPGLNEMTTVALFWVNITFLHLWHTLFFRMRDIVGIWLACADALLALGTAVVVLIMYAVMGQWASFGIYFYYPVWLVVLVILNILAASIGNPTNEEFEAAAKKRLGEGTSLTGTHSI
jgi:hypothetical protein